MSQQKSKSTLQTDLEYFSPTCRRKTVRNAMLHKRLKLSDIFWGILRAFDGLPSRSSRFGVILRERRLAGSTGLEPATSGVTGRRSNQLNYDPALSIGNRPSAIVSRHGHRHSPDNRRSTMDDRR
jgi:hypothetical protein